VTTLYIEPGSPWENDDAERALALRWAPPQVSAVPGIYTHRNASSTC
jgi:hypothetical protein